MKQLIQSLKTGKVNLVDVPRPITGAGEILVQVQASVLSSGTERSMAQFAGKSLLGKARARPDLVKEVVEKARREGPLNAIRAASSRLDQLVPLGYSSAGRVLEVGRGVSGFKVGCRVACAGAGVASHAEVVAVPVNLAVLVDEGIPSESGAFATIGAVALHGIHLTEVRLGEVVVVIGLGLLGQISIQLLKASGCIVIGIDPQGDRAILARSLGADGVATDVTTLESLVAELSGGLRADAVLITADTQSNDPVRLAGEVAKDRGAVVVVGNVGMNVPRRLYYEKELRLRVSRSYGPGRYDPGYEESGNDYPVGYVRWTENRNMQAFVRLVAEGKIDVQSLISHRIPLEHAGQQGYDIITGKAGVPFLGVVITYEGALDSTEVILTAPASAKEASSGMETVRVGMVGSGAFARSSLLPAIKQIEGVELVGICSARGLTAQQTAERFGFRFAATNLHELLNNNDVNTIAIVTRHNMHSSQVATSLRAGKHVFVEKPLALDTDQLLEVIDAWREHSDQILSVGYNRRFSSLVGDLKSFLLEVREPLIMQYRINAGYVPADHWIQDSEVGGGRIIGEACHFVDLMIFLAGALPVAVSARSLPNQARYSDDNFTATIEFGNGSLGEIIYVANGDRSYPKERIEVFGGGAVGLLDDFRRLQMTRNGRTRIKRHRLSQDKGYASEWHAFVRAFKNGMGSYIPMVELIATSLTTFGLQKSLKSGTSQKIDAAGFISASSRAQLHG